MKLIKHNNESCIANRLDRFDRNLTTDYNFNLKV